MELVNIQYLFVFADYDEPVRENGKAVAINTVVETHFYCYVLLEFSLINKETEISTLIRRKM